MNDEDETITRGKTHAGRAFEFGKGKWTIYNDEEAFTGEELAVINIGKNPEAES
jgi:hypothetical protein